LEERLEKRDVDHQDDLLWGRDRTDMIKRVVATTEQGQREKRNADTNGVGLEASIQAALTLRCELEKSEERQQPQPGRQLKRKLTPKPNPALTSTPRTTLLTRDLARWLL
jgi:hypothetical protein